TVVLADSPRSNDRLAPLAKELGAKTCAVDLATASGWAEVMATAGGPAGAGLGAGAGESGMGEGAWGSVVAAHVREGGRAPRALPPGMQARKHGSIVVVGSRNVERPWSGAPAYTASKCAAVGLAQAAAAEILDSGVRINAVLPSTMDTPANRASMPKADFSKW